jgi:hypothetical protein
MSFWFEEAKLTIVAETFSPMCFSFSFLKFLCGIVFIIAFFILLCALFNVLFMVLFRCYINFSFLASLFESKLHDSSRVAARTHKHAIPNCIAEQKYLKVVFQI